MRKIRSDFSDSLASSDGLRGRKKRFFFQGCNYLRAEYSRFPFIFDPDFPQRHIDMDLCPSLEVSHYSFLAGYRLSYTHGRYRRTLLRQGIRYCIRCCIGFLRSVTARRAEAELIYAQ